MKTFAYLLVVVMGAAFVATVTGQDSTPGTGGDAAGSKGGDSKTKGATADAWNCFAKPVPDKPLTAWDGKLADGVTELATACDVTMAGNHKSCKVVFEKVGADKFKTGDHSCDTAVVGTTSGDGVQCTFADAKLTCHYKPAVGQVVGDALAATPAEEVEKFKTGGGGGGAASDTPTKAPGGDTTTTPKGPSPEPTDSAGINIRPTMAIIVLTVVVSFFTSAVGTGGPSV